MMFNSSWRILPLWLLLLGVGLTVRAVEAYPKILPSLPDIEVVNDVGMVPVAPLVELLGGKLTANRQTGATEVILPGHTLIFSAGGTEATRDGAVVPLPLAPYVTKAGVLYVPVQFFVESLGGTTAVNLEQKLLIMTLPGRPQRWELPYTVVKDGAAGKDDDYELYALDLPNGPLRRLTYDNTDIDLSGGDCLPVLLPHTTNFFYSRGGRLVQRAAQDPQELALPTPREADPGAALIPNAISTDGRRLLFTQSSGNQAPLFVFKADEPEAILLTREAAKPVMDPAGTRIACLHREDATLGLYLLSIDGEQRECIERSASRTGNLVFSPDGTMLAYRRETKVSETKLHSAMVVYRLGANAGIVSEGSADPATGIESFIAFSPDSQWMVLSGMKSGLRLMKPDRTEATMLITSFAQNPRFTPDGLQVLFIQGTTLSSIKRNGTGQRKLVSGLIIRDYTFTPDGAQVILCAKPDPTGAISLGEKW